MGQFIFLDDDGRTVTVEDFPNRLLLRQDEILTMPLKTAWLKSSTAA